MVQDYNYTPEQAAAARFGSPELPFRFFSHLSGYRAWEQMWKIYEDMKDALHGAKGDRKRVNKLKAEFESHPMHDLYVHHVLSRAGRAKYKELLRG